MKRHCGGWPIPFAVRLHSHAELSETPTAPAPRCRSPLVCSQTLPTRTGTRHDPPCRPPLVCSQTQACFRRSKPEIGLTLARPGSVRLLLHGRGTCPIRQPSQVHLRVIVAPWSIAVRAAKHWQEWPATLAGHRGAVEHRSPSGKTHMAGVASQLDALAGNRGAVGHRSPSGKTWQECARHIGG
jgi:hypothetical protein